MIDTDYSVTIENVVASSDVGQELNLDAIADDLDVIEYDPEKFPGAVYRTQNPSSASLLFRSGRVVCTGTKAPEDIHTCLDVVFDELRDLGIDVTSQPEIVIQNIVSSGDLGDPLNLNAIAIGLGLENIEYEPEQFPGMVYRLDDPDVVTLLFGSGKVVITGATTQEDAERALDTIARNLTDIGALN